ncbi:MAG: hypothetical protein ACP5HM_09590 [Anaerolineae bacterium]
MVRQWRQKLWERHFAWSVAALWAVLTLLCYGFALSLPFFHDDLPIMTWLSRHGWDEIWFSQENGYYRPLAFTVYKVGTWLPLGARQVALHAVNVAVLWACGVWMTLLLRQSFGGRGRAALGGALLILFPFLVEGVPWITALSHPLVLLLTLLAAYAGLRADDEGSARWWGIGLAATALAPLAHESGAMTGAIAGGYWLLLRGLRRDPVRRLASAGAGVGLNVLAVAARAFIPGAHTLAQMQGLQDLPQNGMYFLQGLLYPLAPLVQVGVRRGGHDFTLLGVAGGLVAVWVVLLILRRGDGRWALGGLWWWACGALPAAASLRYGGLFVSARLYTLASAGVVIFWVGAIAEAGRTLCARNVGRALAGLVALLLVGQSVLYLQHAQRLYFLLDDVYDAVLAAAQGASQEERLGFVNVPSALQWEARVYPLVTDNVVFVPDEYTNLLEFVQVNVGWRRVRAATYGAITRPTDPAWLGQGPWLEGEALRDFVVERDVLWLGRYDEQQARFVLERVGDVVAEGRPLEMSARARFEGGPALVDASLRPTGAARWQLTLDWWASGPLPATVFVHVLDAGGTLVAQDDGAALGGLFPLYLWRAGDRVRDVRYFTLPNEGAPPYSVRVGIYNEAARFPAFVEGERSADDAPQVAVFSP